MGRLAGSADQKKIRKDEGQKARREKRLREMMAESEAEYEDNPFPSSSKGAPYRGTKCFCNVDLTLRQRPQIEQRLQQQYAGPTMESADERPNPPAQRAERVKTVIPRTTAAAVRNHLTGTSEAYLRRVLERVQSWEDARDQARGGREPTQEIPSSLSGTRNSAIVSDNTSNEAHLTPKEIIRQDGLTSDTRNSRTIADAISRSKLLVQLPQRTYGPRETTVESSIKQIGRSEPVRPVSISSTSSKTASSDVELFTPLSPPPELPVSRTSTRSPAEEERSTQKSFYSRDTGHSVGHPSSNLSYRNDTPLAEPGDGGTPFGSSRRSSCSRDELPHMGHRAGFSPLQVQHDDRVRESSIPKIAELNLSDEFGSRPATSEETGHGAAPVASVQNENNSDYEPSSSNPTPTTSARSMSAFGPDSRPITPITGHQDMGDSPSGLTSSHLSLLSSPGLSRASSMPDLAEHSTPSASRPQPGARRRTVLDNYLRAIYEQETRGGPDFLTRQGKMYQEVFRQFFDLNYNCEAPARAELGISTNGNLNISAEVHEEVELERTLAERTSGIPPAITSATFSSVWRRLVRSHTIFHTLAEVSGRPANRVTYISPQP